MKFAANNVPVNPVSIAKSFNNFSKLSQIDEPTVSLCKGFVFNELSKPVFKTCPYRFIKTCMKIKKDLTLKVTKAYKSNVIVIFGKMEYEMKMNNLLDDTITHNKLTKDTTEAVIAHFNKTEKRVLKNHPNLIKRFATVSPYLYVVVKMHKPNTPSRPIISSVGSCTYFLAK